jgi:enoyl-CoA hydratase
MTYEDIRLEKSGNIATIIIDRPKVLNAIRFQTMLEIQSALKVIEADSIIRVVVVTGAGDKAFISGGDISVMARGHGYIETLS